MCVSLIIWGMLVLFGSSTIYGEQSNMGIFINGNCFQPEQNSVVRDGTTFVSVRCFLEELGYDVLWDEEHKQIKAKKGEKTILIKEGEIAVDRNGIFYEMDITPEKANEDFMVSLRGIAEIVGEPVEWDQTNHRIIVGMKPLNGDISLYSGETAVNIQSLYDVEGVGEYAGYNKLMGHPYEDSVEIYFQGDSSGYYVLTKNIKYNPNELVTWYYKGERHQNLRKDLYAYFSNTTELEGIFGDDNGWFSQAEDERIFGDIYKEWFHQSAAANDAQRLVERYLQHQSGVIPSTPHPAIDLSMFYTEDEIEEEEIDGFFPYRPNPEFDEAYASFFEEWIGTVELQNKYRVSTCWLGKEILLLKDQERFYIPNSPEFQFEEGEIYKGKGIRFQYVKELEAGGKRVDLRGIYFDRDALMATGFLDQK